MMPEKWDHRGHEIELRDTQRGTRRRAELVVDGESIAYGLLFDGTFFLQDNAYEWDRDLRKLATRLVEYRERIDAEPAATLSAKRGHRGIA